MKFRSANHISFADVQLWRCTANMPSCRITSHQCPSELPVLPVIVSS